VLLAREVAAILLTDLFYFHAQSIYPALVIVVVQEGWGLIFDEATSYQTVNLARPITRIAHENEMRFPRRGSPELRLAHGIYGPGLEARAPQSVYFLHFPGSHGVPCGVPERSQRSQPR